MLSPVSFCSQVISTPISQQLSDRLIKLIKLSSVLVTFGSRKKHVAPSNIGRASFPLFLFVTFCSFQVCLYDKNETERFTVLLTSLPVSLLLLFLSLSLLQLCVQKLRILIEDSDQNCEPSVNACSVSFSHCLRVSDCGTVRPCRRR